jgi:hypothetical protein
LDFADNILLERLPEGDKDFSLQEDEPEMIKVRIK